MLPFLTEHAGNPTGMHADARRARKAIDDAREVIAKAFSADPSEVIFTSGGTEANNLAITGVGGKVVCSAIEHHAVLEPVEEIGGKVVADFGLLDEATTLASAMLANNETGTVLPLHKIARSVRRRSNALVHTDATQAAAWLDVSSMTKFADLISVSAHKVGGPMGVGALIARNNPSLRPLLRGGGQERERRSGTHNVAGIVGFAAALSETAGERDALVSRVAQLRDRLAGELGKIPGAHYTAPDSEKLPNIAHFCFEDVESEALLVLLDDAGVYASAGASCSSGALQTSHVLKALGVPDELAKGALRLSLGWTTTEADVDLAVKVVPDAIDQLRKS